VFFQAEDGIRDRNVTGVQTCALPILKNTTVSRGGWGTLTCFVVVSVLNLLIIKRMVPHPPRLTVVFFKPLIASLIMAAAAWGCRSEERRGGEEWRARGRAEADREERR